MPVVLAAALLALTAAGFHPIFQNEFVDFDDDLYLTGNAWVRGGLTPAGVAWAFTSFHGANWFPLTRLSWMLDAELFGMQAWGFHLTNLAIHAAAALALFAALARLTGRVGPSWFVAAIFAVHPLHVESVAWASYRRDVLSGLFFAFTLLAYERYARRGASPLRGLAVAVALALGLMSKATLMTLPGVLLLLDWWPLRRLGPPGPHGAAVGWEPARVRRAVREKLPLLALVAASGALTFAAQRSWGAVQSFESIPLAQRAGNALVSCAVYAVRSLWPADLAVFYPHPRAVLPGWQIAAAALALAGVTALCLGSARRRPHLAVGWLWYLGMLVPVIGLVQVGAQARADRYTYLPLVGLGLAVVFELHDRVVGRTALRRAASAAAAGLLVGWCIATAQQVRVWRNTQSLFEHALRVTEDNDVAHINLAQEMLKQGRVKDAEAHAVAALGIRPNSPFAHAALADVQARSGNHGEAVHHYAAALRRRPRSGLWYASLARSQLELGELEAAIASSRAALEIDPELAEAHANLGLALYRSRQLEAAIESYEKALALEPDQAETCGNLGVALLEAGESERAIAQLERAVALRPDLAVIHAHLGRALAERGELGPALEPLALASRLDPERASVHALLGSLLDSAGRRGEAAAAYRESLRRGARSPVTLNNLAWIVARAGDPSLGSAEEAVALAGEAVEATGRGEPDFLDTLAAAHAAAGRPAEAARIAREALALARRQGRAELLPGLRESLARYEAAGGPAPPR